MATKKTIVTIALLMAIVLFGCGDGAGGPGDGDLGLGDGGAPLILLGTISITPSGTVNINTPLTANYSGHEAVSYHWEKDGTAIDGATSKTYTPTSAGIYYATVSAAGYISKTSAPVTVNDPSLLTLSGDVSINPSGSVEIDTQLTANYTGSEGVSYHWEKDGAAIGEETSDTYTPTTTGSYTVIVSATGYNSKVSNAVTVTLKTLSGNINITTSGTTNILLTATYTGSEGVSYHWERDGAAIGGATSNTYTPTTTGSYTVIVSLTDYTNKVSSPVEINTVTFNSNGGSTVTTRTVVKGSKITEPQAITNRDLTFDGWYKEAAFINEWNFATDTVTANIILYAKWKGNGTTIFAIGETGPGGGIVFYYSASGFTFYQTANDTTGVTRHYLEVSPFNAGAARAWASSSYVTTNIFSGIPAGEIIGVGTGMRNSARILATDSAAPAALYCRTYNGGEKTDWFLPSTDELYYLSINRAYIDSFSSAYHWSSTQNNSTTTLCFHFADGSRESYPKTNIFQVRPIRAF